jgi:hypothetical protein
MHAISMHPDDRPASVAVLREELLSSQPLYPIADQTTVDTTGQWKRAIKENAILFLVVVVLLAIALIATLLSPYLPPVAETLSGF